MQVILHLHYILFIFHAFIDILTKMHYYLSKPSNERQVTMKNSKDGFEEESIEYSVDKYKKLLEEFYSNTNDSPITQDKLYPLRLAVVSNRIKSLRREHGLKMKDL